MGDEGRPQGQGGGILARMAEHLRALGVGEALIDGVLAGDAPDALARLAREEIRAEAAGDAARILLAQPWPEAAPPLRALQAERRRLFRARAEALLGEGRPAQALRLLELALDRPSLRGALGPEGLRAALGALPTQAGLQALTAEERDALSVAEDPATAADILDGAEARLIGDAAAARGRLGGAS